MKSLFIFTKKKLEKNLTKENDEKNSISLNVEEKGSPAAFQLFVEVDIFY